MCCNLSAGSGKKGRARKTPLREFPTPRALDEPGFLYFDGTPVIKPDFSRAQAHARAPAQARQ
jgi:hypothetical protein